MTGRVTLERRSGGRYQALEQLEFVYKEDIETTPYNSVP
ncbi:hypothetical protein PAECIP111892_03156 [Paenibacillus auburnensis]|uniref:Uncharacterized protein n=1 Tax=Paenibacillus auburnensis TaxID=2905649 RepID=A0ABM9CBZ7_9BACL|nr:hypothetical protein PAECIP111892_03156 [Paenibacillus auburnensis]